MSRAGHRRWFGLGAIGFGVALVVVDITIVNVAMPVIVADLRLDFADAEWINATYAIVLATFLLTLGRVGDMLGRRRLFLAGLTVFAAASLIAGGVDSYAPLLAARALQGLGAAMILPASLALVNATFRGHDRAIAFGIWGSLIGGVVALGPLAGGWLASNFDWRWIFLLNIPMAGVTGVLVLRFVAESRDPDDPGFDIPGFGAATVAMLGLVGAIIEGPRLGWFESIDPLEIGGWTWPLALSPVPIALAIGVVSVIGFVSIERRRDDMGRPVLFDLKLFRLKSFLHGNVLAAAVGLGEFGLVFVIPLYLQTAVTADAVTTGVVLLAMAIGGLLGGPTAGALARRVGPRQVVTTGMVLEAIGAVVIGAGLLPAHISPSLPIGLFVYGVGVGFASSQLASVILAEVPPAASGQASGMQSTFRQLGAAMGIAALGLVFITAMGHYATEGLAAIDGLVQPQRARIVDALVDSAGWYLYALRAWTPDFAIVVAAIEESIAAAARITALGASAIFTIAAVVSRRLPDVLRDGRRSRPVAVRR